MISIPCTYLPTRSEAGYNLRAPLMLSNKPNLNEGKPWSEMDLVDLRNALAHDRPLAEIADFLCRSEQEVQAKITELGLSQRGSKPD